MHILCVIVSHKNPDGDAIGSSLSLFHYLNKLGLNVKIILPDELPNKYAYAFSRSEMSSKVKGQWHETAGGGIKGGSRS